jgi:hypothetical protein
MNEAESRIRRVLAAMAEEAPVVTELADRRHRRGDTLAPVLAAGMAALTVLTVVLVARDAMPWGTDAPASDVGRRIDVDSVQLIRPSGISLSATLISKDPMRVIGTSLDSGVVATRADGDIWDNAAPDRDTGFDFVDIGGDKPVSLYFTIVPRCDADVDWSVVTINVDTSNSTFAQSVETPTLPTLVTEWCATPMQVRAGNSSASADGCEVTRHYEFINPAGRASTIVLTSPGWDAAPVTFAAGQVNATMVVSTTRACEQPGDDPIAFTVTYDDDGTTSTLRGDPPAENL